MRSSQAEVPKPPGCRPDQVIRQLWSNFRKTPDVHPVVTTTPVDEGKEDKPHQYLVREEEYGTYLDDLTDGRHFFKTKYGGPKGTGGWFLLEGEGSLFGEDESIPPGDGFDLLDSLVASVKNPPPEPPAIPPTTE